MNTSEVNEMVLHMTHNVMQILCNVHFEKVRHADTNLGHITLPLVNLSDSPFQDRPYKVVDNVYL